jgi:uncharacterized protein YkwD
MINNEKATFIYANAINVIWSHLAGGNIVKGQKSPQEVMTAWMNVSGHRVNILNRNYNGIGIGFYNGAWVQFFGKFFFYA